MDNGVGLGWFGVVEDAEAAGTPWLHVGSGDRFRARVVSDEPFYYVGHWSKELREICRCEAPACPFCLNAIGQVRRFVLELILESGKLVYWEFGRPAASQVLVAQGNQGSVRGLGLVVRRALGGGSPPLIVSGHPVIIPGVELPDATDLEAILEVQWKRQALRLSQQQASFKFDAVNTKSKSDFFSDREKRRQSVAKAQRECGALNR